MVFARSTQLLNIKHVFFSTGRELISDEIVSRNDRGLNLAFNKSLDAIPPGLIKSDTVDALQNVNTRRGLADLECRAIHEVSWS